MGRNRFPSRSFGSIICDRQWRNLCGIGLALLGGVLLFSGCAGGPTGPAYAEAKSSITPLNPEMGRIFVYRRSRFTGSVWTSSIILNGQTIGEAPSGAFFYVDRPPGDYTMICILGFSGYQNPEKIFSLSAGQTVYLRVVTDMTGTGLEIMPPSVAANEILSTQYNPPRTDLKAAKLSVLNPQATSNPAPVSPASSQSAEGIFGAKPAAPRQSMGQMPAKPDLAGSPGATNRAADLAATPDEAERILERRTAAPAEGLYALDGQTPFNVLDSVCYDPSDNRLSLVGHFDERYRGPKIPYLQHLAVLLKSPKPEFSLEWTPESQRKVDAFFNQHVIESMSAGAADSLMAKWGELFDREHNLTKAGRLLLPILGVSPIDGGRAPGVIGVTVASVPDSTWVRITNVAPGSAAAAAGLQPGDLIRTIHGRSPLYPEEFYHRVRISGAGAPINLTYQRPGSSRPSNFAQVTPSADLDGDPWKGMTRYDLLKALYLAARDPRAAYAIDIFGMFYRDKTGRDEINTEIRGLLINALGLRGDVNADLKAIDEGRMTEIAAFRDIYHRICEGVDQCFHFQGTPVGDAYLQAIQRMGGDPGRGMRPAFEEFDRQILPKVKELLDPVFERPEGLQIPPELVEEQFHVHPEMAPQYLGLPGDSLLAQVMFDSDYLCKRLMNRPDLKQKIPAYQTGFEFEVKHPQFRHGTGMYRVWISVDRMNTPQSPDGTTLALRDLTMRFNVREQDGSRRDLPNKSGSYEELLTSLWNDFEFEYPTLHELRETAKLAAAARWMLAHNPSATLPEAGRSHWQGPGKVPGLMFMELAPDPVLGPAKTHVTTIAEGGVSEAPPAGFQGEPFPSDTSVVDLRGSAFFSPPAGAHVYTATAPAQGPATTETSPFAVGWTASPDPGAGGKPEGAVVVSSTFGSKVVKANFAQSPPLTPGTDTKAGDQLLSAAATANSAHPENLTQNFDIGGARTAGSVNYGNPDPWGFSKRVRDDPRMIEALKRFNELQARREQLNTERDQLTLLRNTEKADPEKMKQLTTQLDEKDKEYQANLLALSQQKETIAKTKRVIDDTVEDSPPAAPSVSVPEERKNPKPE
jgi:hypothetical protein